MWYRNRLLRVVCPRGVVLAGCLIACGLTLGAGGVSSGTPDRQVDVPPQAKIHPTLIERIKLDGDPVKAWVFFTDKGFESEQDRAVALAELETTYNQRAIQRRLLRGKPSRGGPLFDETDLPVNAAYVDAVAATGAEVHITSKWVNAASVIATKAQLDRIAELSFVSKLQPVARSARVEPIDERPVEAPTPTDPGKQVDPGADRSGGGARIDYGLSTEQLTQINLVELHNAGYTGAGVIVGILDTGFDRSHVAFNNPSHPVNVIAEHDFVDNDDNTQHEPGDPSGQHRHGTMILGCLGSYMPGELVGGAYDASFVVAKTEDTTGEYPAEEDNFVAGLEFLEANGVDMSTASLGYIDWYTQEDMDGITAVTSVAMNIYTSHGIHHTNAAGNEYHDSDPSTSSLIAPADAFDVITCGAVSSSGSIAFFSSDGPTADGRVKPEVLARGVSTDTVDPDSTTGYTTADGTSLSTPLVACAVACLVQARPHWSVAQMRQYLFETADYYVANGTYDPLYVLGYGIIDAYAAYDNCSDAGTVALDQPKYFCEDTIQVVVNDCGLNLDDQVIDSVVVAVDSDSETGVEQLTLTETDPSSADFIGTIDVSTTDAAGVLWVADGDTVTVTYVDADDGDGGTNVIVTGTALIDCTAPIISNVQAAEVQPRSALITFDVDEPVRGTVHYGLACGALASSATASGFAAPASVSVSGLQDATTYFFSVEAEDEAGNTAADDNGGACYSFTTPEVPDFFTEQFEGDFDLENMSITFTPNGSPDFYSACPQPITALPTDPAGGTSLPLSDDSSQVITFSGGQTVALYGTAYGDAYVGSNGYITFGTGDSDYTESLGDHFSLPRLSALFDDLNPSAGGTVSWRQLGDRVAVTWDGVYEYGTSDPNTFQIEMFVDGRITLSYLAISSGDNIVGLSAGNGLDPDFFETDLSAATGCGPLDCNNNGIPDDEDIANCTGDPACSDCNGNGVPDECDLNGASADCNGNGIPDECDTAGGAEPDCNGNTVPDACDISSGTSGDCNANGIPDECDTADGTEPDCNNNSVPDACDIASGTSEDCSGNGIPNECEIANCAFPPWCLDCNDNGAPDQCDLDDGTEEDCNTNGVPDSCDMASCGGSPACDDCDGNGTMDACDIAAGAADGNANGVPDVCELTAPLASGEGPLFVAVTPQPADIDLPVALLLTGAAGDPETSCVSLYVQADGTLGETPLYLTPAEWGTVHAHGDAILPSKVYDIAAEVAGGPATTGATASTWMWGDVNDNLVVNFTDIGLVVKGFQGDFSAITREAVDLEPCTPNGDINFADISRAVLAFQGNSYTESGCAAPCP